MSLTNTAFVTFRRKRGERGEVVETVEDVIVRRLTADRIDALKKLIKETQEKHRYKILKEHKHIVVKESCCIIIGVNEIG